MMMMGLVLATSMVRIAAASAEPGEDAFVEALPEESLQASDPLTVTVDPELFDGETLGEWVQQQGQGVLDRRGPLDDGDRIEIEVGGAPLDYVLTVKGVRRGEPLHSDEQTTSCACTTDQLLAEVEQRVEDAVDRIEEAIRLEEEQAQAEAERLAEQEAHEQAEAERLAKLAAAAEVEPKRYRPKAMGIVGAVGTGLGAGLLVSGIGLLAANERSESYRPSGFSLLGVGGGLLVTGVVLLAVDVVRCKKDPSRCGRKSEKRSPSVGLRSGRMAWW